MLASQSLTTTLPPGPWLLTDTPIHCICLLSFARSSTKNTHPRIRTPKLAVRTAPVSVGVLPELSNSTLEQSSLFMSQRYSPPVIFDACPLKALALGAPTSSLKQKQQQAKAEHGHTEAMEQCDIWTQATLIHTGCIHAERFTTKLMFHVLIVELTQKSLLNWPFRLTGRGFLFSFHKHTEAAFVVQGQGRMPHPGPGDGHPDPLSPSSTSQRCHPLTCSFCYGESSCPCVCVCSRSCFVSV